MIIRREPSVHKYTIYGFKVGLQTYLQVCHFLLFRLINFIVQRKKKYTIIHCRLSRDKNNNLKETHWIHG